MLETRTGAHTLRTLDHGRIHHVALLPGMDVEQALAFNAYNALMLIADPDFMDTLDSGGGFLN